MPAPAVETSVAPEPAADKGSVAKTVAIVGEAYQRYRRTSGPSEAIAEPLRAAKAALADGNPEKAAAFAATAWTLLKEPRVDAVQEEGTYVTKAGDTLWGIAETLSPVKQGPGWVAIWRANEKAVPDFDNVPPGTRLTIPQRPADYNTPYWKPKQ